MKAKITLVIAGIAVLILFIILAFWLKAAAPVKKTQPAAREAEREEKRAIEEAPRISQNISSQVLSGEVKQGPEDNRAKALIKDLENRDWSTARKAAEELVKMGKVAVPDLIDALKNASVGSKGQIVFLLGQIGDREAVPALMETLKDENSYIRSNAAEALGKIKDEVSLPSLATSLFDDDFLVRERSAQAIGTISSSQGIESLINRMIDEKDQRVKSGVVVAFGNIKDQRAVPTLLKELNSAGDESYKVQVIFSLGEIGDGRVLEDLQKHLIYLKEHEPTEAIGRYPWEEAMRTTQEAIKKIEHSQQ